MKRSVPDASVAADIVAALPDPDDEACAPIAIGHHVALRRATLDDRVRVYQWLAQSDLSTQRMGPPLYPEIARPDFDDFCEALHPFCFDGTRPFEGRGFIIGDNRPDGREFGFLHHGHVNLLKDVVELDVWLASRSDSGRGYGSEALALACEWLQENLGVNRFLVRPSRRNVRALRAMRRAGFRETDLAPAKVIEKLDLARGPYADEVLLFRSLNLPPAQLRLQPGRTYVFIDSEFTALTDPRLISFGAVATDGSAFYCELTQWPRDACSPFVLDAVLPLLDGRAVPHPVAARALTEWLNDRSHEAPTTIVSDSGYDRWALADLLGSENLPEGVFWRRVPIAYQTLDEVALALGLRRHHALDDARALMHAIAHGG
jgi:diamine N-acetyltransferase